MFSDCRHNLQYLLFITGLCAIAGIALWILKIVVSPYFPAWSMGLCALAAVLTLICAICTIPDIKEYPYDKNKAVGPHPPGDLGEGGIMLESFKRRPSDIQFTDHGEDYRTDAKRRSDLGREYGRRSSDQQSNRRESKVGKDYDPRGQRQAKSPSWRDDERFELKVVTPTYKNVPPRFDQRMWYTCTCDTLYYCLSLYLYIGIWFIFFHICICNILVPSQHWLNWHQYLGYTFEHISGIWLISWKHLNDIASVPYVHH